MPKRIQRKRSKGWKMPENTIYVGRGSKFGNPFKVGEYRLQTVERVVEVYRKYLEDGMLDVTVEQVRRELRGKDLACWCKEGAPCHADVLLEIANR